MNSIQPFCEWKPDMSVASEELDNQHRHLVDIINEVYLLFINGNQRQAVGPVLDELSQYAIYHFTLEETCFDMFNYYDKEAHIAEHNKFRQMLADFHNNYKADKAVLTGEIMSFLKEWLYEHLLCSDKKYIECFSKNGIK